MSKLLQKLDWLGLLLLVVAAAYFSIKGIWDRWAISLFGLGAITIVIGLVANYKQILQTLGKRSTKYFTNYVVSVLLVLALVAGLNFFGQRHAKRFDMTASGRYTLAPQTTQILGKLTKDLEVKAFFPGATYPPLKELLTQYRGASRYVRFEFIDAEKSPELARQYDVKSYGTYQNILTGSQLKFGTVVLVYGDRKEKIEKKQQEVSEEDLTNAIIKVQRTETKKVYFVQGHGEKDPAETEREGYAVAKQALENQSFVVDTYNVAAKNEIPRTHGGANPVDDQFSESRRRHARHDRSGAVGQPERLSCGLGSGTRQRPHCQSCRICAHAGVARRHPRGI
jgi:ABC-type uncharacterized transport system involved in gliding motility auxiliary subunit